MMGIQMYTNNFNFGTTKNIAINNSLVGLVSHVVPGPR